MTNPFLRRRALGAISYLVPLAGCGFLVGQPAPKLYRLAPRTDDAPHGPAVRRQLVIGVPAAPQSLDTDRIALSRNDTMLDYYKDAAWTDRAPVLLQGLLVEAFENSGRIVAVGRDTSGLTPDYSLEIELRELEARYVAAAEPPPIVNLRFVAKLVKMPDRKIIGTMLAAEQAPAERNDLDSIVKAFDLVLAKTLTQVVDWTLRLMASAR
jgi:cholesterol transport system auxiliary component